jgi:hypothetical protein
MTTSNNFILYYASGARHEFLTIRERRRFKSITPAG